MPLANIEKSFVHNLLLSDSDETDILSALVTTGTLTVDKQLEIYKKNISGAYQKVLAQIYPACLNILGEDYFNQLCQMYRIKHPSTGADLNVYGEYFSSFLKKQIEIRNELKDFEYLPELSLLEWHWHKSYFVENDPVFDFEKLAELSQVDQDLLIFKLSCAFFMHQSAFPLLDIWNANRDDVVENQEFLLPDTELRFCVYRKNFASSTQVISEKQYELLNDISEKLPLKLLSKKYKEFLQSDLKKFIEKGWVTGFNLLKSL